MKSFMLSTKGLVILAIALTLIGAMVAALLPSFSLIGAIFALVGIALLFALAFIAEINR